MSQTYVALEGSLENQLLSHCRGILQVYFVTKNLNEGIGSGRYSFSMRLAMTVSQALELEIPRNFVWFGLGSKIAAN